MQNPSRNYRSLSVLLSALAALTVPTMPHADPLPAGRAILNVCSGPVSPDFSQACSAHAGYFPIHLRLSGDGGCMEMCCSGDSSSGYACVSDPNAIRRVSAIWQGPMFPAVLRDKEFNSSPPSNGVVVTVTVGPVAETK